MTASRTTALLPRIALPFLLALFTVSSMGAFCEQPECTGDVDCTDGVCNVADGVCVACAASSDCGAGSFCCQNECFEDTDIEAHCGCSPTDTDEGTVCGGDKAICLVGDTRADADNLGDGVCGCSCTPVAGGTLCEVDETADVGYKCLCDRADDVGTCEAVTIDTLNNPHLTADTCSPDNECLCFREEGPCGIGGRPADCSDGFCVALRDDAENCGVANRDCTAAATGLDDGTGICVAGGCQCDLADDCNAGNVDSCALVAGSNINQCVCGDYEVEGENAPCPMGLDCVDGGCLYGGVPVETQAQLYSLLNPAED